MKKLTRILLALPLAAMVVGIYLLVAGPGTSDTTTTGLPKPVVALVDHGLDIVGTLEAPSGLTGYAATFHGRPMAVYLTEDGQHAILGTLIDAQGNDLTTEPLKRVVSGPKANKAWAQLEASHWVRDGSKSADTIIYEFTDPNCPFCHKFWQMTRPWVDAGKIQIRHVLVGILKPDSAAKAATILADADPEAAFTRSERNYDQGGIQVASDIPASALEKVSSNNDLMESLGYFATPTILYKKNNGEVGVKQGLPQGGEIKEILGSEPAD